MDWGLFTGFLVTMGVFLGVWYGLVAPSVRRDHERRLALIRKRLQERENRESGPIPDNRGATNEKADD